MRKLCGPVPRWRQQRRVATGTRTTSATSAMVSSSSLACGSCGGVTGCEMVLMLSLLASAPTGFDCRRWWSLSLLQERHLTGSVANDEVDHHGLVLGAGNAQILSRHHGAGTSPTSFLRHVHPPGNVGLCAGQATFPRTLWTPPCQGLFWGFSGDQTRGR